MFPGRSQNLNIEFGCLLFGGYFFGLVRRETKTKQPFWELRLEKTIHFVCVAPVKTGPSRTRERPPALSRAAAGPRLGPENSDGSMPAGNDPRPLMELGKGGDPSISSSIFWFRGEDEIDGIGGAPNPLPPKVGGIPEC